MKKLFKLASKFHGVGPVVFAWHPNGTFLATAGKNGLVHIFDRQGEQHDEIGLDLTAPVIALEWDTEGSTLAILQQGSSVVPLWDNGTRSTLSLDTNLKDPTFARWSKEGSLLAVGTQKGNLVLYSKVTRKLVPIVGKHSRRILCGSWNGDDKLVLGGEDRMLTVSNPQGDTIEQRELSQTVRCLLSSLALIGGLLTTAALALGHQVWSEAGRLHEGSRAADRHRAVQGHHPVQPAGPVEPRGAHVPDGRFAVRSSSWKST
jgi:WD40 repeat protein